MTHIVQKEDPILRRAAASVPVTDITGDEIQSVIADMKAALAGEVDGAAIAAPQIGISKRIFVVAGKSLVEKDTPPEDIPPDAVYINPEIVKHARRMDELDEGCLSVRGVYGQVKRFTKATVHAYDENGDAFTRGASSLLAQIFQHEIDHLDGILFTDKAMNVHEVDMGTHPSA